MDQCLEEENTSRIKDQAQGITKSTEGENHFLLALHVLAIGTETVKDTHLLDMTTGAEAAAHEGTGRPIMEGPRVEKL